VNNLHIITLSDKLSCESRLSRSSCRTCRANRARRVESCRFETWQAKWNLGLFHTPSDTHTHTHTHTRKKRQTDGHQESNLVHYGLKMWHLVAIILTIFLIINWPNFMYSLADPGFLSPLLKFLRKFLLKHCVSSTNRMHTPGIQRTDGRVSLSSCVLDGVWRTGQTARPINS